MRSRRVLEPGISDRPSRRYSARPTTNDFIAESTEVDGLIAAVIGPTPRDQGQCRERSALMLQPSVVGNSFQTLCSIEL